MVLKNVSNTYLYTLTVFTNNEILIDKYYLIITTHFQISIASL